MSYKINRRNFLRATTTVAALAASSAVVLRVPSALNLTSEQSLASEKTIQEPSTDFSEQFVGEGLDYQPLSYWPHINFFNKDDEFYEAVGEETEIVEFSLASIHGEYQWLTVRKEGDRVFYRLSTEYGDLMDFTQPFVSSELPLTLQELTNFIDNSDIEGDIYAGGGIMLTNWASSYDGGGDPNDALNFIRISSPFYPGLEKHYHDVGQSWVAEILEERGEFDDEYEV
ncbi:MAG: twin-arginine translocation signal domain-containing protein [Gammaproteobacteria bacterium]|jgi:hypothetical protein|nr:twin-arginine translocation signal domain-containing protein [Gammaproteobacteria bacterium]